jgi:tryptophan 2,3-dioxygenase
MNTDTVHPGLPGHAEALAERLATTALAELTDGEIADLSRRYDEALEGLATEENEIVLLLTRPFTRRLVIPEYYRYTGLHVFDWFLSRQDDVFGGCLLAAHATLSELARVEREEADRHAVVPAHIAERLRRLHLLIDQAGEMYVTPGSMLSGTDLVSHAREDERLAWQLSVLKRCSGFRRSDKHDEHIFIRSVQACEVTFFMIRWVARQAILVLEIDRAEFSFRMEQLAACSELLNAIFHMLKTLSPELFMGFRDATGDASALQSLNYHLMELVVYGYDERKAETFAQFAHLGQINNSQLRELRSLRDAARTSADPEVAALFSVVERHLLQWRGRHYGMGRTYLPNITGSGGTEGAGYLKRFVGKTGLPSGSRIDDPEELVSRFAFC